MQLERAQKGKQEQFMQAATPVELKKAINVAREIKQRERYNKIDFYDPYPYQLAFHETGNYANQRLLMAANRIGKSYCGSSELSYHLTGMYPPYPGKLFKHCFLSTSISSLQRPDHGHLSELLLLFRTQYFFLLRIRFKKMQIDFK